MNVLFAIIGILGVAVGVFFLCFNAFRKSEYDDAPIGSNKFFPLSDYCLRVSSHRECFVYYYPNRVYGRAKYVWSD